MTQVIHAVGIDMAFANMGLARVRITPNGSGATVLCTGLKLISTEGQDRKEVRKSSDELRRAKELQAEMVSFCAGVQLAFVEVPSGSQSASAARSLGIAVGVLASCPRPIIEVSPMEVKMVVTGTRDRKVKASKDDMVAWAVNLWPNAPWLRFQGKPAGRLLKTNEHLADAMASVMAGISTPEFKRLLSLINHAPTSTPNLRSTSNRRTLL